MKIAMLKTTFLISMLLGAPAAALAGSTGGTCDGRCGDATEAECYCDAECLSYGDCCADACDLCGYCEDAGSEPAPPAEEPSQPTPPSAEGASCVGYCGGEAPLGCFCDSECLAYGDCCGDVCAACGECLDTPPIEPEPEGATSCEGRCGEPAGSGDCGCDEGCELRGDCCSDVVAVCVEEAPVPSTDEPIGPAPVTHDQQEPAAGASIPGVSPGPSTDPEGGATGIGSNGGPSGSSGGKPSLFGTGAEGGGCSASGGRSATLPALLVLALAGLAAASRRRAL